MIMLFKDDVLNVLEISRQDFPEAAVQIGRQSLEHEIKDQGDIKALVKKDDLIQKEYHNFFLIVQSSAGSKEEPYLILDVSSSSCNLYLSDQGDRKLKSLYLKIKGLVESRNIYRYFRNRIFYSLIVICDLFFLVYMFFIKDLFEKLLNKRIPDILLLLAALLVNVIFIVPHGKNRIFLFERDHVGFMKKNREIIILGSVVLIIAALIISSVISMFRS